jgi:acetyl-CoA C-acetyltransferase
MKREKAEELGLPILGIIRSYASGGVDPAYMGLGPVPAVKKALRKAGLSIQDLDIIELNEAFAAQAIACMRELNLGLEKTNPLGSGIALGHPIGATGTRQVVTMLHHMKRMGLRRGLVTLCIGGGQGMAMVIERP